MRKDQAGVTMIGWIVILAILGVFVLAAMRLVPIYAQKLEVHSMLDALQQDFDGENASAQKLRRALIDKYRAKDITAIKVDEFEILPVKGGHEVRAVYEHKTPFFADIGLYVTVNKTVMIRR